MKQLLSRWHHEYEGIVLPVLGSERCFYLDLSDTESPDIMYGRPRGGLRHCDIRTRGIMLKCCTCQAHRDAFFLRHLISERRQCAMTVRILGLDGESAGGKGREVTLVTWNNIKTTLCYM